MYRSISSSFPYRTRSAVHGQIRVTEDFSHNSFKHRARQAYNRIPVDVRTGSLEKVKKKMKLWIKSNVPVD